MMIKLINKQVLFVVAVVLFIAFSVQKTHAQVDDNKDFAIWNTVGLKYSLGDKWKFGLEQSLRLKEQAAEVDEYFTELGIKYELFKNLDIGFGARYITENDNVGKKQGYENHFRFNFDLSYKYDFKRFEIGHRVRYQNKNQLGVGVDEGDIPAERIRFKTSVEYNIRKWPLDPEISYELLSGFQKDEKMTLDKYRLTIGTEYDFKKFGEFGVFFRLEESFIKTKPDKLTVLGFQYTYSIN